MFAYRDSNEKLEKPGICWRSQKMLNLDNSPEDRTTVEILNDMDSTCSHGSRRII